MDHIVMLKYGTALIAVAGCEGVAMAERIKRECEHEINQSDLAFELHVQVAPLIQTTSGVELARQALDWHGASQALVEGGSNHVLQRTRIQRR